MKLTPSSDVDIHKRFREELREQRIDGEISLQGNEMLCAVAAELLRTHAPHVKVVSSSAPVRVLSMERFCSEFLAMFLEDQSLDDGPMLLYSIPEAQLHEFAQAHGIPIVQPEQDDIRKMLDNLAASQPQTYQSLLRSAQRLLPRIRQPKSK